MPELAPVPLLSDTEKENLAEKLRNPQSLSPFQLDMSMEIYTHDKELRNKARTIKVGENAGRRIFESGIRGIYSGISTVAGLPVDAVNAGLNHLGLGSRKPLGGSASLQAMFDQFAPGDRSFDVGPDRTVDAPLGVTGPERVAGRVGEEVGAGAVGLGPIGAAARAGRTGGTIGQAFVRPFQQAPGSVAAAETASATGAGLAAGTVREAGGGETSEVIAGIGGSAVPAALGGAASLVAGRVNRVREVASDALGLGDPEGSRARASQVASQRFRDLVRTNASDPDKALSDVREYRSRFGNFEVPENPDYAMDAARVVPAALQTDDPGLRGLVSRMTATYPEVARSFYQRSVQFQRVMNEIGNDVVAGGDPNKLQGRVTTNVNKAITVTHNQIRDVEKRIRNRLRGQPPETVAMEVRKGLMASKSETFERVKESWDNIDPENKHKILTHRIKAARTQVYENKTIAEEFTAAEQRIFGVIEALTFEGKHNFNEVLSLRRELQDIAQSTNSDRVRHRVNTIRRAVDEQIDDIAVGNYPTGLKERYLFAKDFHQRASQLYRSGKMMQMRSNGVVGDIVNGESPASATLQKFLHTGQGSVEDARQLKLIFSGLVTEGGKIVPGQMSRSQKSLLSNYMIRVAHDATVGTDGRIVPERFAKWRKSFEPVLKEFPEVRDRVDNVGKLVTESEKLGLKSKRAAVIAENRAVTTMMEGNPIEAMDVVFRSSNSAKQAKMLFKQYGKDPEAVKGARQAFMDWFQNKYSTQDLDSVGSVTYRGAQMVEFLKNPKNTRTMKELGFSDTHIGQVRRYSFLLGQQQGIDNLSRPNANVSGADTTTRVAGLTVTSLMSRAYAVARGVVSPRFVASDVAGRVLSRRFNEFTKEETVALTSRAFVDPQVMQTMMMPLTERSADAVSRRLRTHLISLGYRAGEREEDD